MKVVLSSARWIATVAAMAAACACIVEEADRPSDPKLIVTLAALVWLAIAVHLRRPARAIFFYPMVAGMVVLTAFAAADIAFGWLSHK